VRPVINSEVAYEGIAGGSGADLQRLLAWTHLLSGAAGHTYGAHGLWAMRDPADSGPGQMWGPTGWREAAVLPGGRHVGLIASILEQLPWSSFIPHNDWIEPHAHVGCRELPYCAGVEGGTRVAYLPSAAFMPPNVGVSTALRTVTLAALSPGAWTCRIVSPRDGRVEVTHAFAPDPAGRWTLPENTFLTALPTLEDWLLVVERDD
jgi:Protein of unknown function (DUF4038)